MDSFEKQFENLDVQAEFVGTAMGNTTAMSTPQEDVDLLMQQVADEHNISLVHAMPIAGSVLPAAAVAAPAVPTEPTPVPVAVDAEEDELSRRLAELKVIHTYTTPPCMHYCCPSTQCRMRASRLLNRAPCAFFPSQRMGRTTSAE